VTICGTDDPGPFCVQPVDRDDEQFVLGSGESVTLAIVFRPTIANPQDRGFFTLSYCPVETRVIILSNDPDEGELEILLRGKGVNLPPCVFEIESSTLDFGVVVVNQSARRVFEMRNTSQTSGCLITRVSLRPDSDPESLLPSGELISTLIPPGAALAVEVLYDPQTVGQHTGILGAPVTSPDGGLGQVFLTGTAMP
jgi:hypothetical protein